MRLGVKPTVFLARLLAFLVLTYVCWKPVAPAYTHLLTFLTRNFLHLTEISGDPQLNQVTEMEVRQTTEGRPGIMYRHRLFPEKIQGIPAEWVQANMVLLIPLMLAIPAASYRQRWIRLGCGAVDRHHRASVGYQRDGEILLRRTSSASTAITTTARGCAGRISLATRSCRAWTRSFFHSPSGPVSISTSCSGGVRGCDASAANATGRGRQVR